ncbi:MAG: cytochrome ubiquinol oxidase subunit I [Candidatus Aminicenantia bacterium]
MYPIWEVPFITSGLILGLMAVFHILPSHLSTGAMWFNIYVETKSYRENRPELLEFIKKYAQTILVFAYVFGSLSGIGIWFTATVSNPRGISGLIHNYVWGWATEWVFFIIEVTGIFVYFYTLGKVDKSTHLKIGWIFAIGSWTTMIIITGILAFMLSPGKWAETGNFFHGFFNETYWLQLLVRTAFMFTVASTYSIAVGTSIKNEDVKKFIVKSASKWGIAGLITSAILLFLYFKSLPSYAKDNFSVVSKSLIISLILSFSLVLLYLLYSYVRPLSLKLPSTILFIFVLFIGIFSAERGREILRKPYVIPKYMYSNQLIALSIPSKGVEEELSLIKGKGILNFSPFVPPDLRKLKEENQLEAGRLIALWECSSCHTLNKKGLRPLSKLVKRSGLNTAKDAEDFLDMLDAYPYMPPFLGTEEEKKALAKYLISINK